VGLGTLRVQTPTLDTKIVQNPAISYWQDFTVHKNASLITRSLTFSQQRDTFTFFMTVCFFYHWTSEQHDTFLLLLEGM